MDKKIILDELNLIKNREQLEEFHKRYLWKKSIINEEFKTLWKLDPEERKNKWQFLSELKDEIQKSFDDLQKKIIKSEIDVKLWKEIIDISTPWISIEKWYLNLINKTRRHVEEVSRWMWFIIEQWNDLVTKYENFYSVNIPSTHPATEMHDTIYTKHNEENWDNYILRTHTSAAQNYILKKYWAPVKAVIPWKVYRYENMDASHDTVFRQYEWIVVDENMSMSKFKYMLRTILSKVLENDVQIRMRPAFFPFVEPWMEVDASCPICKWEWCSLCKKTGWIEVLWAWMIHPNVLKHWWIDTNKYKWFAFWMWLTRLIAVKYWIKDIRLLTNWDLKFIKSF